MLKFHKPARLRMLGGAAAIVTLGGLSLAFGSAIAQPAPPAPPPPPSAAAPQAHDGERREERVIVRTYHSDGHGDHRDGARSERHGSGDGERREERRVMVITNGDGEGHGNADEHHRRMMEMHGPGGGHMMVMSDHDCQGANRSEVNEGSDSNRTRVIVCTRSRDGARNPAQQAEALQRARARLAEDSELPAEQRQRVLAAIDREIARLRGAQ